MITRIEEEWGVNPVVALEKKDAREALKKLLKTNELKKCALITVMAPKAAWWFDIVDRLVEEPIPVMRRGSNYLFAFCLDHRDKARDYRALLLKPGYDLSRMENLAFARAEKATRDLRNRWKEIMLELKKLAADDRDRLEKQPFRPDELVPGPDEDLWAPVPNLLEKSKVSFPTLLMQVKDEEQREKLLEITKDLDILLEPPVAGGVTDDFVIRVERLPGSKPVRTKNAQHSHHEECIIEAEVQKLEKAGFIEESLSEMSSKIRMVPKPDGSLRMCINYYRLNKILKDYKFPLPTIRAGIDRLSKKRFFTKIDLKSGFWQLPIAAEDRYMTAFSTGTKLYQWKVMPMGLKHAPAHFQSAMNRMLGPKYDNKGFIKKHGSTDQYAFVYIDDILIYSDSFEEHLEHLKDVFRRLKEFGLRINPEKCEFAQSQIHYLGYIVGNGRLELDPDKFVKVKNLKRPWEWKQVQNLICMAGFYESFIPNFTELVEPLRAMVKAKDVTWDEKSIDSFNRLKKVLTSDTVCLKIPDFDKEFGLDADASKLGLGAVLWQDDEKGEKRPVMFLSRKMSGAELNYCTRDKEALAIVWAVTKLRKYLHGNKFVINTDHANLRYMFESEVSGRLARWAQRLSGYDFDINFIKGKLNVVADFLSRLTDEESVQVQEQEVTLYALMAGVDELGLEDQDGGRYYCPEHEDEVFNIWENELLEEEISLKEMEMEGVTLTLFDDLTRPAFGANDMGIEPVSKRALRTETEKDTDVKELLAFLKSCNLNKTKGGDKKAAGEPALPQAKVSAKIRNLKDSHELRDGILFQHKNKAPASYRVYVPRGLRSVYLALAHGLPMAGLRKP